MDSRKSPIKLNKTYVAHCDDSFIVLTFTQLQEVYYEEDFMDMIPFECYLLDDFTKQYDTRAILYCDKNSEMPHSIRYFTADREIILVDVERFLPVS